MPRPDHRDHLWCAAPSQQLRSVSHLPVAVKKRYEGRQSTPHTDAVAPIDAAGLGDQARPDAGMCRYAGQSAEVRQHDWGESHSAARVRSTDTMY